jgi:hypothetical protein
MNGAVWVGEPPVPAGFHCALREWPSAAGVESRPTWTAGWTPPVLPPLAAKLFQESRLRETPERKQV